METILKVAIICLSLFSSSCFSDTLILSTKLKIEYPTPKMIGHSSDSLIVKYKDWSFMHVVVDPEKFYPKVNLDGVERDFIKSMFDKEKRSKFPEWFAALSRDQAKAFGITSSNSDKIRVGDAEILAVHDEAGKQGQIFILEELTVHQISVLGGNNSFFGYYLDDINFQLTFFASTGFFGRETYLLKIKDSQLKLFANIY